MSETLVEAPATDTGSSDTGSSDSGPGRTRRAANWSGRQAWRGTKAAPRAAAGGVKSLWNADGPAPGGMTAVEIYLMAMAIFVLGTWAKGGIEAKAATVKNVCIGVFGCFVFILLDNGKFSRPARLLAWLVFTVAVLSAISSGLLKAVLSPATSAAPAAPAAPAPTTGTPVTTPNTPAVNQAGT